MREDCDTYLEREAASTRRGVFSAMSAFEAVMKRVEVFLSEG